MSANCGIQPGLAAVSTLAGVTGGERVCPGVKSSAVNWLNKWKSCQGSFLGDRRSKGTESCISRRNLPRSRSSTLTSMFYGTQLFVDVSFSQKASIARKSGKAEAARRLEPMTPPPEEMSDEEAETREEEARRRNWVENRWAPWEEHLTPEAQFAVDSLASGEEEPNLPPEVMEQLMEGKEAKYKALKENAEKEAEERQRFRDGMPTLQTETLLWYLKPPPDWPPAGWEVDPDELAFIHGGNWDEEPGITEINPAAVLTEESGVAPNYARWEMFIKQYNEWRFANRERLDREAEEVDPDYYHGRRRTTSPDDLYWEDMYELPFVYPGQHYMGEVCAIDLYAGAFVNFGAVHDGWVPIRDNDWFHIREIIEVGMQVHVEVVAKRDPWRFRFPIELRFVEPNIDHLIHRRFEHPPIFMREGDTNLDEVAISAGRPPYPRPRPKDEPPPATGGEEGEEEEEGYYVHPAVFKTWQMWQLEQMLLEQEEVQEREARGEVVEDRGYLTAEEYLANKAAPEELAHYVESAEESDLNLDAARAEREERKRVVAEAIARGEDLEEWEPPRASYEIRIDELNAMHRQRQIEQAEARKRCDARRKEAGLPVEQPGRWASDDFFGENLYDPTDPKWRHDYWGDPKKFKEQQRAAKEPRSRTIQAEDPLPIVEEEEIEASWPAWEDGAVPPIVEGLTGVKATNGRGPKSAVGDDIVVQEGEGSAAVVDVEVVGDDEEVGGRGGRSWPSEGRKDVRNGSASRIEDVDV